MHPILKHVLVHVVVAAEVVRGRPQKDEPDDGEPQAAVCAQLIDERREVRGRDLGDTERKDAGGEPGGQCTECHARLLDTGLE